MRDQHDSRTAELLPVPPKRGRPATGQAKSGAERMRAQRERDALRRDDALRSLCNFITADAAAAGTYSSGFEAGHAAGFAIALEMLGVITDEQRERALEWHRAVRHVTK